MEKVFFSMIDKYTSNGLCNDELNNADHNYDGGDCCFINSNKDYCSDCVCLTSGVITSPGFPGDYGNLLWLDWIIKVPSGEVIEISFISFDVQYHPSCK